MFQMYHIVIQNIKNYTPFTVIKNNGYIHCAVQYICSFFIFIFVPLNPIALLPSLSSLHWFAVYICESVSVLLYSLV